MADVRPFRALRYDAALADPALTIAPPYDVISADQQAALYARSDHNIVRIEYGEGHLGDTDGDNRYTRAAGDLRAWTAAGVLTRDREPAVCVYRQTFVWEGRQYTRTAYFAAVRLEAWDTGIVKPHEHTLSGAKADRLELLRATRAQISPVYSLFRARDRHDRMPEMAGSPLFDFEADGQHHMLTALTDASTVAAFVEHIAACDVYIADGHHRYETALTYRDECSARARSWSGDEPENFVVMALTDHADPGLLVLPTHRLLTPPQFPQDALSRLAQHFRIEEVTADGVPGVAAALQAATASDTRFGTIGLTPGAIHLLELTDRAGIETLMPADQPTAWKRLDVSVLQYGVLAPLFGIDDAALHAGGAVAYTQDAVAAADAVAEGHSQVAFLLRATPVDQVLAVADAQGRMPQKSTYFYPKIPTGLVLDPFD